jgi:hypothetical protein
MTDTTLNKPESLPAVETLQSAQNKLVDMTLRSAVHMAYQAQKQSGKPFKELLLSPQCEVLYPAKATDLSQMRYFGGKMTEQHTLETLLSIPDDRLRVRAFNQLVKPNGPETFSFDLSLKSAGAKSEDRIKQQLQRSGCQDWRSVSDLSRMMAVSGDIGLLDQLRNEVQKRLQDKFPKQSADYIQKVEAENKDKKMGKTHGIEDWYCRPSGLLQSVLKTRIWPPGDTTENGFGAEVQFLPRQQAHMATRITHVYYEASQLLDGKGEPKENRQEFAQRYNAIARWLNALTAHVGKPFTEAEVVAANALLLTKDENAKTFDEGFDGSADQTVYSKIFKNTDELAHYAKQVVAYSAREGVKLFPAGGALPLLEEQAGKTEIATARQALLRLTQITHACYMAEAPQAMKELYVRQSHQVNVPALADRLPPPIPPALFADLAPNVTPEKGSSHGR